MKNNTSIYLETFIKNICEHVRILMSIHCRVKNSKRRLSFNKIIDVINGCERSMVFLLFFVSWTSIKESDMLNCVNQSILGIQKNKAPQEKNCVVTRFHCMQKFGIKNNFDYSRIRFFFHIVNINTNLGKNCCV